MTTVRRTRLEGTHLVSGAGGAVGSEICRTLTASGAQRVLVCDIDLEAAKRVAAELDGGEAIQLDVADPDAVGRLARRLRDDGIALAGMVNCAAIFGRSPFPDVGVDEWLQVLQVNLVGAYRLVVECLDLLLARSAVVNVTSVEAFMVLSTSGRSQPPYAASKGALQQLTRTLAADVAKRQIRVNAVAPGYIATPINADVLADAQRREFIEQHIPLGGRIGEPADVAGVVAFLLSDDARYMTGQTVVADGGLSLGVIRYPEER